MNYTFVDELKSVLEKDERTHAMWIGGSVAEGYSDDYSDIDLYLDIDDGSEEYIFSTIEEFLEMKSDLDVNFLENLSPPYSHKIYHLAGTDQLHFIEVTLHSHSHHIGLFDRLRKIKVLFDKDGVTDFESIDQVQYDEMLNKRKKFLVEKIKIGEVSVGKELRRKQFLDAMHNYHYWILEPIVELARIMHCPLKVTYGLKHASRDLPEKTMKEIESLYKINSLDDFERKIEDVAAMIKKYT